MNVTDDKQTDHVTQKYLGIGGVACAASKTPPKNQPWSSRRAWWWSSDRKRNPVCLCHQCFSWSTIGQSPRPVFNDAIYQSSRYHKNKSFKKWSMGNPSESYGALFST